MRLLGTASPNLPHPIKIPFGEMRASGVREVPIYFRDHRCSHPVKTKADGWADDEAVGHRG